MKQIALKITTILVLTVTVFSAQYKPQDFPLQISSQYDLSDLLLSHLGLNSHQIADHIKHYVANKGLSVFNALEDIVLLVVEDSNIQSDKSFEITKKFVKKMGQNMDKLKVKFMIGKNQAEVEQYISQNLSEQPFQQIKISNDQIAHLQKLFTTAEIGRILLAEEHEEEDQVIAPAPTQTSTSFSYITKFFFIILFILVTFGSLAAIAAMDNRKDSLLYAKFIADVGR